MGIIQEVEKGRFTITLSEKVVTLANGTVFTEYTVSKYDYNREQSVGDFSRTYKVLATAYKKFNQLAS